MISDKAGVACVSLDVKLGGSFASETGKDGIYFWIELPNYYLTRYEFEFARSVLFSKTGLIAIFEAVVY